MVKKKEEKWGPNNKSTVLGAKKKDFFGYFFELIYGEKKNRVEMGAPPNQVSIICQSYESSAQLSRLT